MSQVQLSRSTCDHCGLSVEVDNLTEYYSGSKLPKDWKRIVLNDGKWFDLCGESVKQFELIVGDWLKLSGGSIQR